MIGSKINKLIYALLDEGSTVTLINSNLINEIGVTSIRANLTLRV